MSKQIEKLDGAPTAIYKVTFGTEVTLLTTHLVGEETVDDADCEVWGYFYDVPTVLLYRNGFLLKELGGKKWYIKATHDMKKWEFYLAQTGQDITWIIDKTYHPLDHGPPYWEGKTWYHDKQILSIPELIPPVIQTMKTQVVAIEEIKVPAGIFNCYKIEYKVIAQDGTELEYPKPSLTLWRYTDDEKIEVKSEYFTTDEQSRIEELVSYNR